MRDLHLSCPSSRFWFGALVFGALVWTACLTTSAPSAGDASAVSYGRDIRPLLADRCFKCHGPDPQARRGKLRLDDRAAATADRGGYAAIVPGRADASALAQRISSADPAVRMPPTDSHKRPLSSSEQQLLQRWIGEGARYEPHWAFVPPARPRLPAVRDAAQCRNAVDRFIRARLEREGVAPSAEADAETLLRRLFLDLTGLPPTPEEIDAFVAEGGTRVWERWVRKLLSEEPYRSRYAEHMATPWLDAARYADTCGIHTDAGRQIWPWRDWVLRAFRDNLPFDQFVTEQIAGDLLPNASDAQKVASGFHRNHVTTDEGGAIAEEYLVEYAVDRTATTGSVFLGLTIGCARCHDHKYDPISQQEFYQLYAFFDSVEEPGLYSQLPDPERAFEPFMMVPSAEQQGQLAGLREQLAARQAARDAASPQLDAERAAFLARVGEQTGVAWVDAGLAQAKSAHGATLTVQADGSVLAAGDNPPRDDHVLVLRTAAQGLRLLLLEALEDPSLPHGRLGRAPNGNAVLSGIDAEAVSVAEPERREPVRFVWVWADHEQANGDYRAVNMLDTSDQLGWAVDAHQKPGGRVALLLAEQPFGFAGGTELRVTLQYHSVYNQHALGRVRLQVAKLTDTGLDWLPAASSGWYSAGPFAAADGQAAFDARSGPEEATTLDLKAKFGGVKQSFGFDPELTDAKLNRLPAGINASYVAKRVLAPTPRSVEVALGSDDGFRLLLNGVEVASRQVDRSLAADQDRATLALRAGVNLVVLKIVNTGGEAGFAFRALPRAEELTGDLVATLLPAAARAPELERRLVAAWKTTYSPSYREQQAAIEGIVAEIAAIEAKAPRTMVMRELAAPRATFVLQRGEYDKPDQTRPVVRGVPAALGRLPAQAPLDRRGLAQWLTSVDNPLVARVAVNRLWEQVFGAGIVRTSEDFGLQGEWPSHPELLDWLAVELREHRWDIQHILTLLVTSATYRQSSLVRSELQARDPDNRWLASFPRRRLSAEQIRDQALWAAGLLVEQFGGPSVKPYQPDGLWQEVAMLASNTRTYVRGDGDDLWRRSLYTYWKRACPPAALMTFDAPTREYCSIRRPATNTPLQALVLWNDVQFVEAARVLAQRTLATAGDDLTRIASLYRRCTGRTPAAPDAAAIAARLAEFRARWQASPAEAQQLIDVGEAPVAASLDAAELAAWTMVASAMLNLDAALCRS